MRISTCRCERHLTQTNHTMHTDSPIRTIAAFVGVTVISILSIPVALTVARAILAYVFQDFTV